MRVVNGTLGVLRVPRIKFAHPFRLFVHDEQFTRLPVSAAEFGSFQHCDEFAIGAPARVFCAFNELQCPPLSAEVCVKQHAVCLFKLAEGEGIHPAAFAVRQFDFIPSIGELQNRQRNVVVEVQEWFLCRFFCRRVPIGVNSGVIVRDNAACSRRTGRRVCRRRRGVSERVDCPITGGGVEDAFGDGGCRINKTARLICPRFRFRCFVKRVDMPIARADIDEPVRDDRIAVASRCLGSPQLCIVEWGDRTEYAVRAAVFNPANPDGAFARRFKRASHRVQLINF